MQFGFLDRAAVAAIKAAAAKGTRLAIATPRVEPGLCLGPTIALALTALVEAIGGAINGIAPFPLKSGERIAILSRSTVVRDNLGDSTVALTFPATRVCQFPTERIKRTGQVAIGFFGQLPARERKKLQALSSGPCLLLYDLAPIQDVTKIPECAVIIAELAEVDSNDIVERLFRFAEHSHAHHVFPIVSRYDDRKLEMLRAAGFQILDLIGSTFTAGVTAPTFDQTSNIAPPQPRISFTSIDRNHPTALALGRAHSAISDLQRIVGGQDVYCLRQAWSVLDALSSVCVPLPKYEAHRRLSPSLKTIDHVIYRLRSPNYSKINERVLNSVRLRWSEIMDLLAAAYEAVSSDNPLYSTLAELVIYGDDKTSILLPSTLLATALREELMIGFGWDGGSPIVESVRVAARAREVHSSILTTGFRGGSIPRIWSMLPQSIQIVGYPHEMWALQKYGSRFSASRTEALANEQSALLSALFDSDKIIATTNARTVSFALDAETLSLFSLQVKASGNSNDDGHSFIDEPNDYEDFSFEDSIDGEPAISEDEEEAATLSIRVQFADGSWEHFKAHTELLVAPADEDRTVLTHVEELREGDTVLFFSDEEHRNAFQVVLSRVRHLIDVDERYLRRWQSTIGAARVRWSAKDSVDLKAFFAIMRAHGCERTEQTMRNWLAGRLMAPEEPHDIACILKSIGVSGDVETLSKAMDRELDRVRSFHRALGRRFRRRYESLTEPVEAKSRVDAEIDDFLQDCDPRIVESITIPKSEQPTLFQSIAEVSS